MNAVSNNIILRVEEPLVELPYMQECHGRTLTHEDIRDIARTILLALRLTSVE